MDVKDRVKIAREARGWPKYKVEDAAGFSRGYLSVLESGKRGDRTGVRADTLEKLARVLEVSSHWLLTGEGEMERIVKPSADTLPNQQAALDIARAGGIGRDILDAVQAKRIQSDQSVWWWCEEIFLMSLVMQHGSLSALSGASTHPPNSAVRSVRTKKSDSDS